MSERRRKRRPYARILRGLALSPIVLAPHLLAGVSAELSAVIACALVASMLVTLLTFETAHVAHGVRGLTALLCLLVGWAALQTVPFPCGLLTTVLGEDRTAGPREVAQLLGRAPYCAISVDPGLTLTAVVRGAACLLAFLVASVFCSAGHRSSVIRAIALSGASISVSSLFHLAYAARRVYGLYEPRDFGEAYPFGPILNLNHLGGFCALTVPALVAAALDAPHRRAAGVWFGAAAATVVVGLMTLSRSGMLAILIVVVLVSFVASRRRDAAPGRWLVPGLVLAFAAIGTWFVFGSAMLDEYLLRDRSKLDIIARGLGHAVRQGVLGHGASAFGIAALEVSGTGDWLHYAESLPAQWIGDYGIVVGTLGLVVPGTLLARTLVWSERTAQRLMAAGLVAFVIQNLADFGIEMTGIAVVASAALAATTAERDLAPASRSARLGLLGASAFAGALVLALLPTHGTTSVTSEIREVVAALSARRYDLAEERVADSLHVHPRNPAFALLAAAAARARNLDETVSWLNVAMRGAPHWWSPHHEAALFFAQRGRGLQAAHEARVVATIDRGRGALTVCALARLGVRLRHLTRAAPERAPGAFLADCVSCLPSAQGAALDAHLLTWRKPPEASLLRAANRALDARAPAHALEIAQRAQGHYPRSGRLMVAQARALAALKRTREAVRLLQRAGSLGVDEAELASLEAFAYAEADDEASMRRALARYRDWSSNDPDALARAEVVTASLEHRLGNSSEAIKALERAYTIDGRAAHQAAIMRIARERGWEARAELALRQLCNVEPSDQACVAEPR